jgi:hypothetical protein
VAKPDLRARDSDGPPGAVEAGVTSRFSNLYGSCLAVLKSQILLWTLRKLHSNDGTL